MPSKSVRVFISYSHESPRHKENVLKLCNRLRSGGIDAWIDRYESPPPQGWPLWMEEQLEAADFVLIVITATWSQRAKGKTPKNVGMGVRWEGRLIRQLSYEASTLDKFLPVYWGSGQEEYIPAFLRSGGRYDLDAPEGFDELYRRLRGQAEVLPPPLGHSESMAPPAGAIPQHPAAQPAGAIDVLVFTLLPEERAAFVQKLEDVAPVGPTLTDVFSYHRATLPFQSPEGRRGRYQIVVAMPLQMGTQEAVAVASRSIDHWKPRYVLIVGIAGAVRKNDVKLGDILIADKIVDYELQKLKARKDEMRPRFYDVDAGLLSASQTLVGSQWIAGITAKRPGDGVPDVRMGLMASGDKVFARAGALQNILKSYPKLLGVEMEAAGAALAAQQGSDRPRLFMVRSASDFADAKTDAKADAKKDTAGTRSWRSYACDAAANFAVSLLRAGALLPLNGAGSPASQPETEPAVPVEVGKDLREIEERKRFTFEDNVKRYGFSVDQVQVTKKICPDGSSTLSYRVQGLKASVPLTGVRFEYHSGTGMVGTPAPDDQTRLKNIGWAPDRPPSTEPLELAAALEAASMTTGAFEFTIGPDDPPLSWAWDLRVLNGDAMTEWEYQHLYTAANQKHFDDSKLRSAMEYFARLVWIPVKQFVVRVELPASISSVPALSVFSAGGEQPPVRVVVENGLVKSYPDEKNEWVRSYVNWRRDAKTQNLEAAGLRRDGDAWTVAIDFPPIGSAYSIDWILPKAPLSANGERLVRKAEAIRSELLRYRRERLAGDLASPRFQEIKRVFSDLDSDLRALFKPLDGREVFDVYLMSYAWDERKLHVIDGLANGQEVGATYFDFALPFGLGLAGAAFKAGKTFVYRRPLEQPEGPDYFIPVKGSHDHTVLLAVPLDHPEFDATHADWGSNCCQQLLGVVNIGSNYVASNLIEVAPDASLAEQVEVSKEARDRINFLKARCKKFAAEVAAALVK